MKFAFIIDTSPLMQLKKSVHQTPQIEIKDDQRSQPIYNEESKKLHPEVEKPIKQKDLEAGMSLF